MNVIVKQEDKGFLKLPKKDGFAAVRQKGSHVSLHKKIDNKTLLVVVPMKAEIKK